MANAQFTTITSFNSNSKTAAQNGKQQTFILKTVIT